MMADLPGGSPRGGSATPTSAGADPTSAANTTSDAGARADPGAGEARRHTEVSDPPASYSRTRVAWVLATALLVVGLGAASAVPEHRMVEPGGFPCTDSDSDGLCDDNEDANTDTDNDPATNPGPDTDGDTTPNYLDSDDDGDGIATASENADPDTDGEPRDAVDSDHDGQPDYLDRPTDPSTGSVADEQKISDTQGGLTATLDNADSLGFSVAAIGDLDGDGVNDLAVGTVDDDDGGTARGALYILFLNANGTVKAEQKISDTQGGLTATLDDSDNFAAGIAAVGDLDGDGLNEIAVGAVGDDDGGTGRGAVHLLFLNTNGTVRAEQKISDTQGGLAATLDDSDSFGRSVTAIGDLDGDGIRDIAVGATGDDDGGTARGALYILFLNANGTVKAEQKISDTQGGLTATLDNSDFFGISAAGIGDLDEDGVDDIAVGATGDDDGGTFRGAVHVLFLNSNGTVKAEQKISDTQGGLTATLDNSDFFGVGVAGIGDLDGDGVDDIAVGASADDDGGADRGAVHLLFLNGNGTVKAEQKISDTQGGLTATLDNADLFGTSVAGIGDLDGDGVANLAVGATDDDDGGTDRGAVHVLDLAPEPLAIVNSTDDDSDNSPGDDVCDTGGTNSEGDPECTLRAAIQEANASATVDTIHFAIPTSDGGYSASPESFTIQPSSLLPTISTAMTIDGSTQTEFAAHGRPVIEIDGVNVSAGEENGLYLTGGGSTIRSLAVNRFGDDAIDIEFNGGNTLKGNYVGIDVDGTTPRANAWGINIKTANNTVGGTTALDRNVVSGNTNEGFYIYRAAATGNVIQGNYVGTNAAGDTAVPNAGGGFRVFDNLSNSQIGGTGPGEGNVISGNGSHGIEILSEGNDDLLIAGNHIGVNAAGTAMVANGTDAIRISGGGDDAQILDNLIAHPNGDGIDISGPSSGTVIQGNIIGTDAAKTADWSGRFSAIGLESGASNTLIGGTGAGEGNVLANGGSNAGNPNNISIWSDAGSGISILGNSIFGSRGLGIDLDPIGVTSNDAGDGDSGPNDLLNYPVIGSATEFGGTVTVTFDLDVPANPDQYRVEFFTNPGGTNVAGNWEGEQFRSALTTAPGTGLIHTFSGAAGDVITATVTAIDTGAASGFSSTSEFSPSVTTTPALTAVVNSTGDASDASPGNGLCDTGGTNSQGDPECTLRAAIEEVNADADPGAVEFSLPATEAGHSAGTWTITPATVLPNITGQTIVDGSTQPGFVSQPIVELDGNLLSSTSEHGLTFEVGSDGSTVNALNINSFPGAGIRLRGSDNHTITGNVLGLQPDGTTGAGNRYGMYLAGSSDSVIGGTTATERNVISDSLFWGIAVYNDIPLTLESHDTVITGNYFGTDVTGLIGRGNTREALFVVNGSDRTRIGGPTAAEANVIADSGSEGIYVGTGGITDAVVEGNIIGLGADQTTQLPNDVGVVIGSSTGTRVIDNIIGPQANGGISMSSANGAVIQGNVIGTDSAGTAVWPIGGDGIAAISSFSSGNLIGGTGAGEPNTIANVADDGVSITAAASHPQTVLGNSIFAYGDLAIDLGDDGVTDNDGGDGDTGPNELLNKPVITDLSESGGTVTVTYDLDVPVLGGGYRVEFFRSTTVAPLADGEAKTFIGAQSRAGSGTGYTFNYSGAIGDVVTASVTEDLGGSTYGDTSEMALARALSDGTLVVTSTEDDGDTDPGDGICHTGAKNSGGQPGCTLRAAMEEANTVSSATDTISFAMPTTETGHSGGVWTIAPGTELPYIGSTMVIDGRTQPGWSTAPVVTVSGSAMSGTEDGFTIQISADDSALRGLAVVSFPDDGILTGADRVTIGESHIGVLPDGFTAAGNGTEGIVVYDGADSTIDGNMIGGHTNAAIVVSGSTTGTVITGNLIGTDAGGTVDLGNGQGLWSDTVGDIRVGGTGGGDGNVIANSAWVGIQANNAADQITVLGNEIRDNGGIGIDLVGGAEDANFVTANDGGDGDSGPNGFLNHPVITDAVDVSGTLNIDFDLDTQAGNYRIEFFTNPNGLDPSGYGEGEDIQHDYAVVAHPGGSASYSTSFTGAAGDAVTATTTVDLGGGSFGPTSEFSAGFVAVPDNQPPTADSGGPYTIAEGEALTLDGSGTTDPDPDTLTYAWDLDNDAAYDDATGVGPTIAWATLVGLGIDDDGSYPIGLQVDDSVNPPVTDTATLTVTNTAPTITTSGASTTPAGATYTLTLGVSDPGADAVTGWIIDWGDGTVDTIVGSPATTTHVYANEGYANSILAAVTDEDGTWHQNHLLVASSLTDDLLRYERTTGTYLDVIGNAADGLSGPAAVTIGPDGAAHVASATTADVRRFDPTGGYLSTLVAAGAGGLGDPSALAFGSDGNLYVADATADAVLVFDGSSGLPLGDFVTPGSNGLDQPRAMVFGPSDDLFVADSGGNRVLRFDGDNGSLVEEFVAAGAGGLADPRGLVFGADGDLYVTSAGTAEVLRYSGIDGTVVGTFVAAGSGGLTAPDDLVFGPTGDLYVADSAGDTIRRYDGTNGSSAGDHVVPGSGGLDGPPALAFAPGQVVVTDSAAAPSFPNVSDSSVRRSDLTTAGGLSTTATAAAIAADGFVLAGGTERLVGPGTDITSDRLSMSAWVNRSASAVEQRLVAKTASAGSPIYELTVDGATGEAVARLVTGGVTRVARGGAVGTAAWHHVAATWDGTSLVLYVDGLPVDTVAAAGALATDPGISLIVGNVGDANRGLVGTVDEVRLLHRALTADEVATAHRTQRNPGATVSLGGQQQGVAGAWAVDGTQARSGSFALRAPTTTGGSSAWATAIGIDEPGVEVDTWWWLSTDVGVEVATGVRTGVAATDQWETMLDSPGGWDLGRLSGVTRTQDAPEAGTTVTGSWVQVTVRSDQNGDSSVFIDGTEIIGATGQGSSPTSGSIGLRAGLLPPAESWFIDDVRGRRLVSPEPVTTLGSLDRN